MVKESHMPNAYHALIFLCWMIPATPEAPEHKSCVISHEVKPFETTAACQKSLDEGFAELKKAPSFKQIENGEITARGVCHLGPSNLDINKHQQGLVTLYEGNPNAGGGG